MSRAGDTVGKAVGSGWLAVRRGARRAGQASAEATIRAAQAADQKLTERGVAPQQLGAALAESAGLARQEVARTTRRTRKRLARTAKHTRKELAKAAEQARRDAKRSKPVTKATKTAKRTRAEAAKLAARTKREAKAMKAEQVRDKRRRWPKVFLLIVVASGVAYVVRGRTRSQEPAPVPPPRNRAETNGQESSESTNVTHNGRPTQESHTQ
ncbi:hypothetical protein BLA60_32150 [Actinophytocola xinjiangensis]|uniref:Uncharacterized protein n=2 Tax=Actinophytocola xinjiangensis TaxID=485602 RepID=A0A7Z0WGM7_9PSEU|nr:hypothetical protein BLA60_32150 [Actinophytocola xinjiangensis]